MTFFRRNYFEFLKKRAAANRAAKKQGSLSKSLFSRKSVFEPLEERQLLAVGGVPNGAAVVQEGAASVTLNVDFSDAVIDTGALTNEEDDLTFVTNGVKNQYTMSWDAISGAESYNVKVSRDGGATWNTCATPTDNSCTVYTVYTGSTCMYRVQGVQEGDQYPSGDYLEGKLAPISLTASAQTFRSGDSLAVTLVGSSDASASIRWYRVTDAGDVEIPAAAGLLEYAPTDSDVGVAIKVVATGTGYSEGSNAEVVVFREAPAYFSDYDVSTRVATLNWPAVENAASYRIWRLTDGAWVSYCKATPSEVGELAASCTARGLYAGNSYSFKIGAYEASNATGALIGASSTTFAPIRLTSSAQAYCRGASVAVTLVGSSDASASIRWYRVTDAGDVEIPAAAGLLEYTPTGSEVGSAIKVVATGTGASEGSNAEIVVPWKDSPYFSHYDASTREATFHWPMVEGATSYRVWTLNNGVWCVYRNVTPSEGGELATSCTARGLYAGNTYSFRVRAFNASEALGSYEYTTFAPIKLTSSSQTYCSGGSVAASLVGASDAAASIRWYKVTADGDVEIPAAAGLLEYTPTGSEVGRTIKVVATGTGASEGANAEVVVSFLAVGIVTTGGAVAHEGAAQGASVVVEATEIPASPITVTLEALGTANPLTDYQVLDPLGVRILPTLSEDPVTGETRSFFETTLPAGAASVALNVVATGDVLQEETEYASFALVSASGTTALSGESFATVRIVDANSPYVELVANDAFAAESPASTPDDASFTITRTNYDLSAPLTVKFELDGTATPLTDYTLRNANSQTISVSVDQATGKHVGYVQIPANQSSVSFTLRPQNDTTRETTENVSLRLVSNPSNFYNSGELTNANVTIADNDDWFYSVAATVSQGAETSGAGESVVFRVMRTGSDDLSNAGTFWFRTTGTATYSSDYTVSNATFNSSLNAFFTTIPSGSSFCDITFNIENDSEMEGVETLGFLLIERPENAEDNCSEYSLGADVSAFGTIDDNDCWSVDVSSSDTFGAETASSETSDPIVVTVTRSGEEDYSRSTRVYYRISGASDVAITTQARILRDETVGDEIVTTEGAWQTTTFVYRAASESTLLTWSASLDGRTHTISGTTALGVGVNSSRVEIDLDGDGTADGQSSLNSSGEFTYQARASRCSNVVYARIVDELADVDRVATQGWQPIYCQDYYGEEPEKSSLRLYFVDDVDYSPYLAPTGLSQSTTISFDYDYDGKADATALISANERSTESQIVAALTDAGVDVADGFSVVHAWLNEDEPIAVPLLTNNNPTAVAKHAQFAASAIAALGYDPLGSPESSTPDYAYDRQTTPESGDADDVAGSPCIVGSQSDWDVLRSTPIPQLETPTLDGELIALEDDPVLQAALCEVEDRYDAAVKLAQDAWEARYKTLVDAYDSAVRAAYNQYQLAVARNDAKLAALDGTSWESSDEYQALLNDYSAALNKLGAWRTLQDAYWDSRAALRRQYDVKMAEAAKKTDPVLRQAKEKEARLEYQSQIVELEASHAMTTLKEKAIATKEQYKLNEEYTRLIADGQRRFNNAYSEQYAQIAKASADAQMEYEKALAQAAYDFCAGADGLAASDETYRNAVAQALAAATTECWTHVMTAVTAWSAATDNAWSDYISACVELDRAEALAELADYVEQTRQSAAAERTATVAAVGLYRTYSRSEAEVSCNCAKAQIDAWRAFFDADSGAYYSYATNSAALQAKEFTTQIDVSSPILLADVVAYWQVAAMWREENFNPDAWKPYEISSLARKRSLYDAALQSAYRLNSRALALQTSYMTAYYALEASYERATVSSQYGAALAIDAAEYTLNVGLLGVERDYAINELNASRATAPANEGTPTNSADLIALSVMQSAFDAYFDSVSTACDAMGNSTIGDFYTSVVSAFKTAFDAQTSAKRTLEQSAVEKEKAYKDTLADLEADYDLADINASYNYSCSTLTSEQTRLQSEKASKLAQIDAVLAYRLADLAASSARTGTILSVNAEAAIRQLTFANAYASYMLETQWAYGNLKFCPNSDGVPHSSVNLAPNSYNTTYLTFATATPGTLGTKSANFLSNIAYYDWDLPGLTPPDYLGSFDEVNTIFVETAVANADRIYEADVAWAYCELVETMIGINEDEFDDSLVYAANVLATRENAKSVLSSACYAAQATLGTGYNTALLNADTTEDYADYVESVGAADASYNTTISGAFGDFQVAIREDRLAGVTESNPRYASYSADVNWARQVRSLRNQYVARVNNANHTLYSGSSMGTGPSVVLKNGTTATGATGLLDALVRYSSETITAAGALYASSLTALSNYLTTTQTKKSEFVVAEFSAEANRARTYFAAASAEEISVATEKAALAQNRANRFRLKYQTMRCLVVSSDMTDLDGIFALEEKVKRIADEAETMDEALVAENASFLEEAIRDARLEREEAFRAADELFDGIWRDAWNDAYLDALGSSSTLKDALSRASEAFDDAMEDALNLVTASINAACEGYSEQCYDDSAIFDYYLDRIDSGETISSDPFEDPLFEYDVCFIAGTPVLMADGSRRPIESLRPGDMVLACDHLSPESAPRPMKVARFFDNGERAVVRLVIGGEELVCTPEHPFHVVGRGWVSAESLNEGDQIRTESGDSVGFISCQKLENETRRVYNIEVEDAHTYFVGSVGLLVHNTCWGWEITKAFGEGLVSGFKGVTNGLLSAGVSFVTLGTTDYDGPFTLTATDLAYGAGYSQMIGAACGEVLIAAGTMGAATITSNCARASTAAFRVAQAVNVADGVGNVVSTVRAAADVAENGFTVSNTVSLLAGGVSIGANVVGGLAKRACFVENTEVMVPSEPSYGVSGLVDAGLSETVDASDSFEGLGVCAFVASAAIVSATFRLTKRREKGPTSENSDERSAPETAPASSAVSLTKRGGTCARLWKAPRSWHGVASVFFLMLALAGVVYGVLTYRSGSGSLKPETVVAASSSMEASSPQLRKIQELQLGDRVLGENPQGVEPGESDDTIFERVKHCGYSLTRRDENGDESHIRLLRPADWLEMSETRVRNVYSGREVDELDLLLDDFSPLDLTTNSYALDVWLELPEMGVVGWCELDAVDEDVTVKSGDGNVVTGTFEHVSNNVIDLYTAASADPIGVTTNHPFWSEDRQDFVPAGELAEGERVLLYSGETKPVVQKLPRPGPQRVYNLEVYSEHVYLVSKDGVLVHNYCSEQPRDSLGRFVSKTEGEATVQPGSLAVEVVIEDLIMKEGYSLNQILTEVNVILSGRNQRRRLDIVVMLDDKTAIGIEVKSGNARKTRAQREFDELVTPDTPAIVLRNENLQVIGVRLERRGRAK